MSANIKVALSGKELNTMKKNMNSYSMNFVSCGASAPCANAQYSCAHSAAMTNMNIANLMGAIILASIIISLVSAMIILWNSQILEILLPLSVITLLACKTINVVTRP